MVKLTVTAPVLTVLGTLSAAAAATKTNFLPSVRRPQTLGRSADDSIAADIAIGAAATTAGEVTVGLVATISVDVCNVNEAAL